MRNPRLFTSLMNLLGVNSHGSYKSLVARILSSGRSVIIGAELFIRY
ncbi:MAG: hypothetical protein ACRBBZ_07370 [Nitrosopumilus sp.]